MKTIRYHLITSTGRDHVNPGDTLIGKGIQYLLKDFELKRGNIPVFNYINIFGQSDAIWDFCYDHADVVVLCGTPQLDQNEIPTRFNEKFYEKLKKCKQLGKKVLNLWAGFVYQDCTASVNKSVQELIKYKEFINDNFDIYNAVVARDEVTQKVLESTKVKSIQLVDCVSYSPFWYNIKKQETDLTLFVPREIGEHNKLIAKSFQTIEDKFKNVLYLCHSYNDYKFYKQYFKNIIVSDALGLVDFYSQAKNVISLRIHGSVLASHFGCNLVNVSMDSRAGILDYFGIKSQTLFDFEKSPSLDFAVPNIQNKLDTDRAKLYDLLSNI